jgi:FtsZ-interacting cell division protein ZipA
MPMFNGWRLTRTGVLFVIGIIVLAGLVFGGIVLVRERGEQARRNEAIKVAEQSLKDESEVAVTPVEEKPAAEESTAMQSQTTTELPQTGPELTGLIAVTILSLSAAFYVTSRRAVRDL